MSEQAHLWSRYHAAALQTQPPEQAAKTADKALAAYNERFETLAKHEKEMTSLALELEVRCRQVQAATTALMGAQRLIDAVKEIPSPRLQDHMPDIFRNVRVVLQAEREYVIVPSGMDENDPRLGFRRRP